MTAYWAIFSARFRALLQYRAAAAAGFGCQMFWGLIRMMIFAAFYRAGAGSVTIEFPQMVTYIWLGQAMIAMMPWRVDPQVAGLIRSGNVAYELVRPLDLYNLWFCRSLAQRTAPTLMRLVPQVLHLCHSAGVFQLPARHGPVGPHRPARLAGVAPVDRPLFRPRVSARFPPHLGVRRPALPVDGELVHCY